jgi:hypothetical protein
VLVILHGYNAQKNAVVAGDKAVRPFLPHFSSFRETLKDNRELSHFEVISLWVDFSLTMNDVPEVPTCPFEARSAFC